MLLCYKIVISNFRPTICKVSRRTPVWIVRSCSFLGWSSSITRVIASPHNPLYQVSLSLKKRKTKLEIYFDTGTYLYHTLRLT